MTDWRQAEIAELLHIKHGFAFPGAGFGVEAGLPVVVTPGNFAIGGGFVETTRKTFRGDYPNEYLLQPESVVVTMTDLSKRGDTLGYSARIPRTGEYLHNQRIGLVEIKAPEAISLDFAYLLLQTAEYRHHVLATATGSTVRHTSPSRIGSHRFSLPPLDEQRRIAEVLGALDDLIYANEQLADRLLSFARVLAHGATAPVVALAEVAEAAPFRTVTPSGETAHYSLPAFDNGAMPELTDGGAIKSSKVLIDSDVVLLSRLNPHIPRVWAVYPDADVMNVASTEFVPLRGLGLSTEEIYALVSSSEYLDQLSSRVTGTTGSHQRVDKRTLLDLMVPDLRAVGPESRQVIGELIQEAHASRVMSAVLRRTRGELLPLMLSGAVLVRPEGVAA